MRKLLTILFLFISASVFAQNTVTLETGTTSLPSGLTWRYKAVTPDSLNRLWALNPLTGKYNRIYTATEVNKLFAPSSLLHWTDTLTKIATKYDLLGIDGLIPTNGLQKIVGTKDSIGLGAPLTQNTNLNTGPYNLNITNDSGSGISIGSSGAEVSFDSGTSQSFSNAQSNRALFGVVDYASGNSSNLFITPTDMTVNDPLRNKGIVGGSYFGRNSKNGNQYAQVTLVDSTAKAKADSVKGTSISGVTVKKIDLIGGIGDSMTAGGQSLSRINSNLGGTTAGWGFNTFGIAGDRTSGMLAKIGLTTSGNYNTVIVLGGVNDAFALIPAATVEANLQAIYTALHNAGIKVIASTILPCSGNVSWSASVQTIILAVNSWIKTTATNVDVVVDNYVNMADPTNATALNPAYDSGDHLHPSDPVGYNALGDFFYNATTWTKRVFVYGVNVASDTRINQNLSTGDNVSFQRVNTSQIIVNNDRQFSIPWPAMATTLVTGVQTPVEGGAFYDTDKHLPGYYDGTVARYLTPNPTTGDFTVVGDVKANSIYYPTDVSQADLLLTTGGVKAQRNKADAVAAFTATQVNAGSTGNIQNWQFGGNVQASMTYRGYLSIGASTTNSLLNVQQSTQGTGTISNSASGTTVTGVGTIFTNTFLPGQTITANGETHTISAIASNTSMTTDAWTGANSGVAYTLVGGSRLTVDGNGNIKIPTFGTAGIVHNSSAGLLSTSLVNIASSTDVTGFQINNITAKTANYTVQPGDFVAGKKSVLDIPVDATSGNLVITLPSASTFAGYEVNVIKTDATANTVTINTSLGNNVLSARYQGALCVSNSAAWYARGYNATASATGANPTATAGKTAINGSATTFMRSDAAPKIDSTSFQTVSGLATNGTAYFGNLNKINFWQKSQWFTAGITSQNGQGLQLYNSANTFSTGFDVSGGITANRNLFIPDATGTLSLVTNTETLTNKTLTTPKLTGYTVSGLPTGTIGMIAYVTDALTPAALAIVVGGGSSVVPVFFNGTNWVVQ